MKLIERRPMDQLDAVLNILVFHFLETLFAVVLLFFVVLFSSEAKVYEFLFKVFVSMFFILVALVVLFYAEAVFGVRMQWPFYVI